MSLYKCGCCGFEMFDRFASFEICLICGWQDDIMQNENPDMLGANKLSLNEYKPHWPELVREERRWIKKRRMEGLDWRQRPSLIDTYNAIISAKGVDTGTSPEKSSSSITADYLHAFMEEWSGIISEEATGNMKQFIAQDRAFLGMEYILWYIFVMHLVIPKKMYDTFAYIVKEMGIEPFYLEGIRISEE